MLTVRVTNTHSVDQVKVLLKCWNSPNLKFHWLQDPTSPDLQGMIKIGVESSRYFHAALMTPGYSN